MAIRTITLTGRPPVQIDEEAWPFLASAADKSYEGEYDFQSNLTSWLSIAVRRHDDGRAIVYATYRHASRRVGERGYSARAGVLLPADSAPADICAAIQTVCRNMSQANHFGDDANRWPGLAAECIADMPAETI